MPKSSCNRGKEKQKGAGERLSKIFFGREGFASFLKKGNQIGEKRDYFDQCREKKTLIGEKGEKKP